MALKVQKEIMGKEVYLEELDRKVFKGTLEKMGFRVLPADQD